MKIGIIGAMQVEVDALHANMTNATQETISGVTFVRGQLHGHDVIAAVCGIGKVFAAICAQTMILNYQPDCIINIGVAGSTAGGVKVLDIVIAEQVCQHDMDTSPIGDPVGLISGVNMIYFPAHKPLADTIGAAADQLGLRHVTGTIASGDQFIHTAEKKAWIHETFGAMAAEMEGAAIGHVCYVNQVPFAVLRTISDGDGAAMDYSEFAPKAARQSIDVIMTALEMM